MSLHTQHGHTHTLLGTLVKEGLLINYVSRQARQLFLQTTLRLWVHHMMTIIISIQGDVFVVDFVDWLFFSVIHVI